MNNQLTQLAFLSTVGLVCLLSLGCGAGSDTATISGTIATNGTSIPEGRIVFSSETATCAGKIVDGKYQLMDKGKSSVPLGDYTITVLPPEDTVEYDPDTGEEEAVKSDADPALFPKKYQNKETTDLKFSPVAGENEYDINLKK